MQAKIEVAHAQPKARPPSEAPKRPRPQSAKQKLAARPQDVRDAIAAVDKAVDKLPASDTLQFATLAEGAAPGEDIPPNAGSKVGCWTAGSCDGFGAIRI